MRYELDALLCERYPEIFRDRHADMRTTCMCRGFDCQDGWFDILDSLCHQISELVKTGKSGPVVATQVKEKYGTLHFYVLAASDEVLALIDEAEAKSEHTCECCGQPGMLRQEGWCSVRCKACEEAEEFEQEARTQESIWRLEAAGSLQNARSLLLQANDISAVFALANHHGFDAVRQEWEAIRDTPEAEMVRKSVERMLETVQNYLSPGKAK